MSRSSLSIVCLIVAAVLVCTAAGPSPAQTQTAGSSLLVREKMPNDIGFELLGKSIVYSFYYQRTLNRYFAIEAGLGALGGGGGDDNASILFFPIGARLYAIPKNGSFFVAGGAVFLNAATGKGPFSEDSESTSYGYLGPGMEFRSESGFLFRGTAYGLINGGGFFIWPGLTVGYAF
jgi:hypothetical protein